MVSIDYNDWQMLQRLGIIFVISNVNLISK